MRDHTKRLTIDIDAALHGRLKARAAIEGTSMRELCIRAIERELARPEEPRRMPGSELVEHLRRVQSEVFGDRVLSDSTEIIREMREERSRQMDRW